MSSKPEGNPCGCSCSQSAGLSAPASGEAITKLVQSRATQDAKSRFNLRIVPARSLDLLRQVPAHCQPRGHARGWGLGQFHVGAELLTALAAGDKAMVAWLTKDIGHADRSLANPVAAMAEAGVALTATARSRPPSSPAACFHRRWPCPSAQGRWSAPPWCCSARRWPISTGRAPARTHAAVRPLAVRGHGACHGDAGAARRHDHGRRCDRGHHAGRQPDRDA